MAEWWPTISIFGKGIAKYSNWIKNLHQIPRSGGDLKNAIPLHRITPCNCIWRYRNEKWPWHFTKIIFYYKPMLSSSARRLQLTKERQHLTVRKKVRWCRAIITISAFPWGKRDFQNCSDCDSDDTSVREIPKSEANLPSDGKVGFSRNLKNELGKCQGH